MSTYVVSFERYNIETTVADTPGDVDRWIWNYGRVYDNQKIIVGLDIEWRPTFGRVPYNKAATLQLCFGTRCLIVQLIHLDYIPESLRGYLRDPDSTFVGVEIQRDVAKLNNDYGFIVTNAVDVRECTMSRWPSMFDHNASLKDLARELVGLSMPKPQHVSISNWQARLLSWEQIQYASIDAFASYMIGVRLFSRN